MITIESNIPKQELTFNAGGATSIQFIIKDVDEKLVIGEYPTTVITYEGVPAEMEQTNQTLQNHITNTNNPHQVEAKQMQNTIDFTLLFDNALI